MDSRFNAISLFLYCNPVSFDTLILVLWFHVLMNF